MTMHKLQPGDTIGIMAPSSSIDAERLNAGINIIESFGLNIALHDQTFSTHHQSAGSVEQKINAFHSLIEDKNVKALWCAGGGNRSAMLLPYLDIPLIKNNPKPIIGFSDSTSLLNGVYAKTGIVNIHAPVVQSLPRTNTESINTTFNLLFGSHKPYEWHEAININNKITADKTTGHLIGGTLSVLTSLCGTNYIPTTENAILFIEDINEELSRIDRMINHLKLALPFQKLSAIILGQFINTEDTGKPFGFSLEEIIKEHTKTLTCPVIINAPFGHGAALPALPVGQTATISISDSKTILTF